MKKYLCLIIAVAALVSSSRAEGPLSGEETVASMRVYGDLQLQLFAAEPMISNPTNITVDELGRVWLCDVVNYRGNQGKRPAGDRILVLEDTDGDGRADESRVFYQGHDVDSALGICVLGEQVIVSCAPEVFVLSDEDGDGHADNKRVLYTKTGKPQHDHAAHAFVFGPDGCLYWNVGNENEGVFDAEGNVKVDLFGREVRRDGNPFRQGMAFRQSFDGSEFEVLAHNLRNSYELTIDAFGDVWFTDNDDDGNRGTRFCFTLNGGNYGYTDERTGESWRGHRWTGMHQEIPLRHWHQNDPGAVPNVLNNGSGSPSGVEIYAGSLLPEKLRGGIVHCEPGHNTVRIYLPKADGGGFTAETVELIDGRGDPWFRPVDAATAPDGSLIVADWYDPGVGGHRQADIERGRIYRVAPSGVKYHWEPANFETPKRCCDALCSGNMSTRAAAWSALARLGTSAEAELLQLSHSEDSRARARAYWLLTRLPENGRKHLRKAANDADPRLRAAAARMTNQVDEGTAEEILDNLAGDPSATVRRATAIELRRYHDKEFAPLLWARLAQQFDGTDRWYLEALGLAAEFDWDRCLNARSAAAGEDAWQTPAGRQLVWRSRGKQTLDLLLTLLADPQTPPEELPRLLRAIDFTPSEDLNERMLELAEKALEQESPRRMLIASEALHRLDPEFKSERLEKLLNDLLANSSLDENYASLVMQFQLADRYADLVSLATGPLADTDSGIQILQFLVGHSFVEPLKSQLNTQTLAGLQLARMLALTAEPQALQLLLPMVNDSNADQNARREAVRGLTVSWSGSDQLLKLAEAGDLDEAMYPPLAFALQTSPWQEFRDRAAKLFPEGSASPAEQFPVALWMDIEGDVERGKLVFAGKANCATCHKIGENVDAVGKDVGPALTEIGSKLSRTGLYESILFPSAAISHNYETYVALTDSGVAVTGVLIGESDETVTLKTDKAVVHEFRRDELESFTKSKLSLMPAGVDKLISPQELSDLVAYLGEQKKK